MNPKMRASFLAFTLLAAAASAAPVISEFMASNATTLKDGHDKYEDWIELWNPDATSVDLAGWRLTDNATNTTKFVFPTKVVPAGGRVVVFASNRAGSTGAATHADPLGYLHTNFSLAKGGEYLGLISPAGAVSTEFAPAYPQQVDDISYGPPASVEAFTGSASPIRYKVPTSNADDTASPNWTQQNFTDTSWTSSSGSGVGFEVGSPTAAWLLDEPAGATSAADFTGGGRSAALNGTGQTFGAAGANVGTATAVQLNGSGGLTVPYSSALNPAATFTFAAWVYPTGGSSYRAVVSSRVGPAGQQRGYIMYITPSNTWEFWTGNYPLNKWDVTTANTPVTFNAWTHVAITRSANGTHRLFINGVQVAAIAGSYYPNNNTANGFHLGCGDDLGTNFRFVGRIDDAAFWSDDIGVSLIGQHMASGVDTFPTPLYPAHFQTNVQSAMYGVNPGIYTRHNFTVSDRTRYASLRLRAKYDDGFVAFLNGVEIARRNFAATRNYNSVASSDRLDTNAVVFEDMDVTAVALPALTNGANTLAIHGMTVAGAPELLLTPVLDGTLTPAAQTPGYFAVATPAEANSATNVNPGPDIVSAVHSPAQPAAATAVTVTATVRPRLAAIGSVSLKYRVQYGAESAAIPMTDAGPVAGATDGSRLFTGTIPSTHGATARQMLRYYITATDTAGRTWRAPYPVDLTNDDGVSQSPEYFGTVIADATLTSSMPIMQWFTNDVTNSDTRIGSRASVYYGGFFYDNIYVRQRGGYTSSGSQKFNFNAKEGIYVNPTLGTVGELNMNSSGVDPNLFRVSSAYAIYRAAGHPALEAFPVAMIRNGAVHRIAHLIEQLDEDYLKRQGFDNDGALYKFVQRLGEENTPGNVVGGDYSGSPGFKFENPIYGVEKKTRLYEGFEDYTAFTQGIATTNSVASRRVFLFKNMNIPNLVNFMAVRALISEEDVNRKNFYAFRDTIDSQEWFLFPWDKDMTLGMSYSTTVSTNRNNPWQSTFTFLHDPTATKQWCVLWQTAYDIPEVRTMVGRRLRSLMDTMMGTPATAIPGNTILEQKVEEIRAMMLTPPPGYSVNANYRDRATFNTWLGQHRTALYTTYGPASGYNMIPNAASALPVVTITNAAANPPTAAVGYGNQDHEFIEITNSNAEDVDVSGWTLWNPGSPKPFMTFPGGTVIPGTSSAPLNKMNVVRTQPGFRNRPGAPTTAEFVVGRYDGQLSARGETIQLRDGVLATSRLVSSYTTPSAPTAAQQSLRVTELMFAPTAPTAAELVAAPATVASDYEYIELQNISATTLDVSGARFTSGVDFTFPAATTLAPGQRILLVANSAAFAARYGAIPVAGVFTGTLDNSGDRLRIEDSVGEMVLDFSYNELWFPPADAGGRSIVVRNASPDYATYDLPTHWALSGTNGGTPAAADNGDFANHYDGWRWDHFNAGEIYLPEPANPPNTLNTALVGPSADAEGDGLSNFAEYAFGRQPRVHDNSALTTASIVNDGGLNYLAVTFKRRHKALDVTYTVETTDTLGGVWTPAGTQVGSISDLGNGIEQVTIRDSVPQGSTPRYIRVRAVKP
ncbi:MAG: hypothetical protein RL088_405 [Verrucomicrobiota bacterium]|jgi:hypothetical protein